MERLHSPFALEEIRHHAIQKEQEVRQFKVVGSPVGPITLIADDVALLSLIWGEDFSRLPNEFFENETSNSILEATEAQLNEYFSGNRTTFDIPLAPNGTPFQNRVWQELLKIPYGVHITYGEQARRLGQPNAARAVGAANGKNPIGLIIPCHRVIGASGSLTGFAGGLEIKRKLLELEGPIHDNSNWE